MFIFQHFNDHETSLIDTKRYDTIRYENIIVSAYKVTQRGNNVGILNKNMENDTSRYVRQKTKIR